jgi:hypothetical protein
LPKLSHAKDTVVCVLAVTRRFAELCAAVAADVAATVNAIKTNRPAMSRQAAR